MKTQISISTKLFLTIIPIFLILNLLTGCGFYYKVQSNDHQFKKEDLVKFIQEDKYFILHETDTAWCLSNIMYNDTLFSGTLSPLPKVHMKYKTENGEFRYKINSAINENGILNEVHLYISDDFKKIDKTFKGNYSSVFMVSVNSKNKGKTAKSWILPIIIVPVVAVTLVAIMVASSMHGGLGVSPSVPNVLGP